MASNRGRFGADWGTVVNCHGHGRAQPHLAIEVISDHDARDRHWERKLAAYQRSGIRELARFDPEAGENPLSLWDRVEGDLVEREVSKHELELSDVLGAYWIVEPAREVGWMLRLSRDSAGSERLLTDDEARRVEAEARRAAEARVRELEAELALHKVR